MCLENAIALCHVFCDVSWCRVLGGKFDFFVMAHIVMGLWGSCGSGAVGLGQSGCAAGLWGYGMVVGPLARSQAFALNKRMDKAEGVVEYMKTQGTLPDLVIWTTLINGSAWCCCCPCVFASASNCAVTTGVGGGGGGA